MKRTNILSDADNTNEEEHENTGELIVKSVRKVIVKPQSGGADASEFTELPDEGGVHCPVTAASTAAPYVATGAARAGVVVVMMVVAPVTAPATVVSAAVGI